MSSNDVQFILSQFPQITEAVVYGVKVPFESGKAGMASIQAVENPPTTQFLHDLADFQSRRLPRYAFPVFLRFDAPSEKTHTFKSIKTRLAIDSFHTTNVFVWDKSFGRYEALTDELMRQIQAGKYRF